MLFSYAYFKIKNYFFPPPLLLGEEFEVLDTIMLSYLDSNARSTLTYKISSALNNFAVYTQYFDDLEDSLASVFHVFTVGVFI